MLIFAESNDADDESLVAAHVALEEGRIEAAYDLAASVMSRSNGSNALIEARVLAFLAHCDRMGSKLRRASTTSRKAAQLFEQLGDVQGEAGALSTLAHVCILLGRNAEAVEAALLSVRLCESKQPQAHPLTVVAMNSLGLAYSWSGDHKRADAALDAAALVAESCVPAVSVYQPRLNQFWVEASRLIDERFRTGAMNSLTRLEALAVECQELERRGSGLSVLPGLQPMRRVISAASWSLLAAWQGDVGLAQAEFDKARDALDGRTTWLDAFVRWCAAEIAWATGDWVSTRRELELMRTLALGVEHEQLARRAHLLLIQIFELQGMDKDALRENRVLREREQRLVGDALDSREALVTWRLGARQSERHLRKALETSRQFERWSLEDALTGIANRRHFEQSLTGRLHAMDASSRPLVIALIDVDRFKSVNDRFSHQVGDRVLKTVAAIMASQLREGDLFARWAGDEFVILFDDALLQAAARVCERVEVAVAAFDWGSIATGLRMTVSIGFSQAQRGDTAETAIHRSDKAMYLAKP